MPEFDMREEKKTIRRVLLSEGWRKFKILSCSDETKSKSGNNMYVLRIQDEITENQEDFFLVSEPKKRWILKILLDVCGVECREGVYHFEKPLKELLIGQEFMGFVTHEEQEWINREGQSVKTKKHRITDIKEVPREEEVAWDSNIK